jgi:hypothetical protein
MKFEQWVMLREVTDDPIGGFIADARTEISKGKMPDITSKEQLRVYLEMSHAHPKCLPLVPEIWLEFTNSGPC